MSGKTVRTLSIFTLLCCHYLLPAQQDTLRHGDDPDPIRMSVEMHPVLLRADRNALPYAVSKISAGDLQKLHEPIIEPVLNATPGLWMQSGTLNTNRISIRGVGYREPFATTGIKVYLDDIPLTNGAGEASFEDIHPGLLSGIEIMRGPASAMWGAGLGGMILLRTEIPQDNVWQGRLQAGSFGRLQADQSLAIRYGERSQWGTRLHVQHLSDEGFRENNQYDRTSFTWMQQWSGDNGWSVSALVHGIDLKAFIPSSLSYTDFIRNPQIAASSWAAVRGHEDYTKFITGLTAGFTSNKGLLYRGSVFGTWFASDEVRPFNVLDERSVTYGTRQRIAWQVHASGHVSAGAEFYRERYTPETYETLPEGKRGGLLSAMGETRTYLHAFVQTEWNMLNRINVFAGLSTSVTRLSGVQLDADIPAEMFPTVGVRMDAADWLAISANLSKGYSALSLNDFINSDGSVADILPETGWSREASIVLDPAENITARVTGYVMRIENTVLLRYLGADQYEKYNGGKTLHRGIEAEVRVADRKDVIAWNAAWTYNDHVFEEFNDGGIDYAGNNLPGNPRHRIFHTLSFKPFAGASASVSHHVVSEVFLNDRNDLTAEAYHLLNISMEYVFQATPKLQLRFDGHVHNLTGTHYAPMFQINAPGPTPRYYYPGKPRSVYVRVAFGYSL